MDEKSRKKNNDMKNRDSKKSDRNEPKSHEIPDEASGNHSKNVSEKSKDSSFASTNIGSVLSAAEKSIKEFYDAISRKISNFVANDLHELKNVSKEELTKLSATLITYKKESEELSQEKLREIRELRKKLKTRLVSAEEVQNFMKYLDERITSLKKLTENLVNNLRKNEAANVFIKDLQEVIANSGKRVTSAVNNLYSSLKDMAESVSRSVTEKDETQQTTKSEKMSASPKLQQMPSVMNKMLKNMGTAAANDKNSKQTMQNSAAPVSRSKGKLPFLNLSKHFNTETMYGRANIAKATYAVTGLVILYYMVKPKSKK